MILDFTISNFRSIREPQTISFEASKDTHLEDYYVIKKGDYRILKMAVILGANASGKSNIIRAFNMFPLLILDPCENKSSKIEYSKFALDKDYIEGNSVMIVNFICGTQKYRYEVHFNNNMVIFEILQKQPFTEKRLHTVFERTTDQNSHLSKLKFGDKYRSTSNSRLLSVNLIHNRTVFGAFEKSNIDIPWMKEIVDWVQSYLNINSYNIISDKMFYENYISENFLHIFILKSIDNKDIDNNMMAFQLQKSDIGVSGFNVKKVTTNIPNNIVEMYLAEESLPQEFKNEIRKGAYEEVKINLLHKGNNCLIPFDFENESGGTQRYFQLSGLLLLSLKQSLFFAIDELECRLHPDLYTHFITTFLHNAKESQIVFTTHMREFLADKDMFRDDIVWFTEKNDEGATELYSLADFGSDVLRDSSNRYNFYRAGRLGAIPRLGDTFIANSKTIETDGKAI